MELGLYGKLPSHGDFLTRRVSEAFIGTWDQWLQQCLEASRAALGERWLEVYLTSPAWRFVCGPGTCGPTAVIGLMAPSVDRVGRYFPLTLVAELPSYVSLLSVVTSGAPLLARAEQLVIETLAADDVDFEQFDQRVIALGDELQVLAAPARVSIDPSAAVLFDGSAERWQLPIGSSVDLPAVFEQFLSLQLSSVYDPLGLWWTDGSAIVEPSLLMTRGLPRPESFAALLEGSWARHHWPSLPARLEQDASDDTLVDGEPLIRFRSAAATDMGCARGNNEDGFLERPEIGLWAVADGMGGHSDGEIASQMVCDALADFEPHEGFEETVEAARRRMQEVNDHLLHTAERLHPGDPSGSTVVMVLARGRRVAVLWAGDSRVYRWRRGRLEQLSRDHSLLEFAGSVAPEQANIVTRAVGAQPSLVLDLHRDTVSADDRFLLCSDGLTRVVPEELIAECLQAADISDATEGLISATLEAGAPDNVTVLVVEAYV